MDEIIKATILGIVEGLTEFVPVSSTGHLIIANHLVGFTGDRANTFDVFIQLGAILAVVILYWRRFLGLFDFSNGMKETRFAGLNGLLLLLITSIPAFILGFLGRDFIKDKLFNPLTVAIGLLVGGIALILVERFLPPVKEQGLDSLTWKDALVVGLFQCLALWPGTSRSAATIVGAMLWGVQRKTAAEYSFFAAVPILFFATIYDMIKSLKYLSTSDIPVFGVGFLVSFIAAWFAVKFFINLIGKITMVPFGWYRIAVALLVILLLATSVMSMDVKG
ncbi:MAG: undecaprenyl-diphosphate phosphatase [Chloroflexi bacterium]|uniref:Undecaprenyl-diphosphatase n=1 Tax=Candidatus Chlorohelix allophototropha TaxID=3003348 RepID=A0A8T7M0B3_9CHLR|nr:undecaprenyl-diphosphate phosphatase [Chloroflexota bacterium]WJW67096.1 undecaprenyl-diphosphate phosphatase [Chloroflexota bacterium L227-S17]